MKSKSNLYLVLKQFFNSICVSPTIVCVKASEQIQGKSRQICHQTGAHIQHLEKGTPWAKQTELFISFIKHDIRKDLKKSNCSRKLWDYCAQWRMRILNATYRYNMVSHGIVPHFFMTG